MANIVLRGIVSAGHEVVAVLTREPAPFGRKKTLTRSPVALQSEILGLPVIEANQVDSEVIAAISAHKPDLAIVVAYGVLLDVDALNCLQHGWFNVHFSLLPKWRGAAPVQHAIMSGESETGVTLFRLDKGMDTGPILANLKTTIGSEEDAGALLTRLATMSISLVNAELPSIYSGLATFEDQVGEPSFAPKTSKSLSHINIEDSATSIHNLVRAMNPEPVAWMSDDGSVIKILRSRILNEESDLPLGTVRLSDKLVVLTCGDRTRLELLEVQPESRKVMNAKDWFNGKDEDVVLA